MGKLLILSLDESEQNLYSKIMKIVSEAGISADRIIDQEQKAISHKHWRVDHPSVPA